MTITIVCGNWFVEPQVRRASTKQSRLAQAQIAKRSGYAQSISLRFVDTQALLVSAQDSPDFASMDTLERELAVDRILALHALENNNQGSKRVP